MPDDHLNYTGMWRGEALSASLMRLCSKTAVRSVNTGLKLVSIVSVMRCNKDGVM